MLMCGDATILITRSRPQCQSIKAQPYKAVEQTNRGGRKIYDRRVVAYVAARRYGEEPMEFTVPATSETPAIYVLQSRKISAGIMAAA